MEFQKINNELILDRIYNNTDSQLIQGEPDIYWIQKGGQNPISWCKKLKNRLPIKKKMLSGDQQKEFRWMDTLVQKIIMNK